MPIPKSNETEQDFVSRCVPIVMGEGSTQEQALGKCYGMFRSYQSKKSAKIKLSKMLEDLHQYIEKMELVEKYKDEIDEIKKARTVNGYESPEPGELPEAGADLLARVYSKCRADGGDKEKCSKIAWSAVRGAGYKSDRTTILKKAYNQLQEIIIKQKEKPIDEPSVKLKDNYFDTLHMPAFLMAFPFNMSNSNPNNVFMNPEQQGEIDHQKAFSEWMELYKIVSAGSLVYILPSNSGLQDESYVANIGLKLPSVVQPNTVILSNYKSKPREGEEPLGNAFFNLMEFEVKQPPTDWEGEADLKYIRDNIFIGGYGIRTDKASFDWMMDNYNMKIIPVKMTDERLYHFDCNLFPIDNENVLVVTKSIDPADLKQIESIVNIIDVPLEFGVQGSTNCVRMGSIILNASAIMSMKPDDKEFEMEKQRVDFLVKTLAKFGKEVYFVNLKEFDKSGAALSCCIMHLNYFDYEAK